MCLEEGEKARLAASVRDALLERGGAGVTADVYVRSTTAVYREETTKAGHASALPRSRASAVPGGDRSPLGLIAQLLLPDCRPNIQRVFRTARGRAWARKSNADGPNFARIREVATTGAGGRFSIRALTLPLGAL
jgi:hypothetical protein